MLDLDDRLSAGMVRAAGATALLDKQLNSLSGRSVQSHRTLATTEKDVSALGRTSDGSGKQIDKLSGRLQILAEVAGAVGPAFIPIGAAAIPAVAGLANQLGVAALAGGTAVLAFQGVGTALAALSDYQLEPTAAHMQALQEAMSAVGPAGRDLVRELEAMKPLFEGIQNTARQGLFPGVTDALQGIATRAPEVNHLIETISTTLGGLLSEAGQGIEGGALDDFIRSLDEEARPALTDLGHSIADVTLGLTDLFQAFLPLSLDFGSGMARAAAGFREWAAGLSQTQGFQDFVEYLRTTGPQVLDLLGALGNDFVQIVEAAAPLGGPVLESLTAIAKAISAIADSPLGTPIFTAISALSAYNLALKATVALQGSAFAPAALTGRIGKTRTSLAGLTQDVGVLGTTWMTAGAQSERESARVAESSGRVKSALVGVGKGAAVLGGVGLLASGTADKLGLTNTATLGLAGSMAGPLGAAAGGAVGAFLDLSAATSGIHEALDESGGSVDALTKKLHDLQTQASQLSSQESSGGIGGFLGGVKDVVGGNLASSLSFLPVVGSYIAHFGDAKTATQELNSEIGKTQSQLNATAGPLHEYENSIRNSGVAAGHTAAEINGMVAAMQANRTAALGAFDAETQYRQALKAAQAQAAKNNAGIRGNSDAALANRQAISGLASAWNNQSDAVKNNVGRFHEARRSFIETASAMGVPIDQAKRLADRLLDIPKSVVTRAQIVGGLEALRQIDAIKARLASIPRSISTSYYVNQINSVSKAPTNFDPTHGKFSADGSTVPKDSGAYADRYPYLLAPGEEVISNRYGQADRHRGLLKAINAGRLATGGTATEPWNIPDPFHPQSPVSAWNIRDPFRMPPGLTAVIRELNAAVKADAHQIDELSKARKGESKEQKAAREREVKALERHQKALEKDAERLKTFRSATRDFNPASALPQQDPRNPIYANVRGQVNAFEAAVVRAGGTWTKAMERHSSKLEKDALALDRANRKHDALTAKLGDLTSQMTELTSTMNQFGSSVAGNFQTSPFGLGGQSTTFQPTVDNSPALSAATDQLNAAKAHLAALSTGDGDINTRLANAYAAQGVAADVAKLQAQVDQLSQPVTTVTDSLSAFRDQLEADTKRANDFNAALLTLGGDGLSTDFLSSLAQSGDVAFAQALAGAGEATAQQYAALFDQRNAAAAQVAATATQLVYGQQQAVLQAQINHQNALITKASANIDRLDAAVRTLGNRVENGAEKGVAGLKDQLDGIRAAVAAIPRQIDHAKK